MVSSTDRVVGLKKLMTAHPDWNWDYWVHQLE